ncbi:hypothetical protein LCGC14_2309800 [marine sediment metagenome]|uniref:HTH cro/C1-type domain-containing protein n=1 Tax=marine sediment metagenome TaxID=412755 RepID=A0A0F9EYC6_9ZZZZ
MGFREWLRGLLKNRTYRSQYEMAQAFSVKQPTVHHWLHGKKRPGRESCGHISDATGKPLADIYEMVRQDVSV